MAGQSISFDTLLDVNQVIRYNQPTTDAQGNAVFQFANIVTNVKCQASSTGDVRDVQTINPAGGTQATAYTPQQIYSTVNGSTPGPLLAADLKAAYNEAVATVVS